MEDNYEKFNNSTWKAIKAFSAFSDLLQSMAGELRNGPSEYNEESDQDSGEEEMEESMEEQSYDDDMSLYPSYCQEDFPGRKFFDINAINPDDPEFHVGKEIGIPQDVAVRNDYKQNKFIPSYWEI